VTRTFELFIAKRYLRARRKETVISVITVISLVGVAAGVMALVIALAVTNGFRGTLQRNLLGIMPHISVVPKTPGAGIENWRDLMARLRTVPHVTAVSPALFSPIFLSGALQSKGAFLKGIDVNSELAIGDALSHLKQGSLDRLRDPNARPPAIILGSRLVEETGMTLDSQVKAISPEGEMNFMGPAPSIRTFRVGGIFETGFYEIDDGYAFASVTTVQRMLGLDDVVNMIELKVDDLDHAPEIAKQVERVVDSNLTATAWQEQNRQLLNALRTERVVTVITIGLIELVAALNILITLVMMVMEKYRDIAVLMSMGARLSQIRRIFVLQGLLIGVVGSAIGLTLGYTICYLANRYHWIRLEEQVYSMSFVPFEAHWVDGLWIAGSAILVSFLATLYPARNATRIAPAEVLRYE
jgi:lipoprotein-releasing system permease protein